MSLERIVRRCCEIGINCLAVADHNTISGAVELKKIAPFTVIVGEEILTPSGEVMGLFLTDEIPQGLSPEATVARIKEQGGLVCIPHPFHRLRRSLRPNEVEALVPQIDIIEVFNSRSALLSASNEVRLFAQKYGLLCSAGSDAHTLREIGGAYVEMPPFNDPEEFRLALARGRITGRRANPLVHILSSLVEWKKQLKRVKKPNV